MMSSNYSGWWCGRGVFFHDGLGMVVMLLFWGLIIYLMVLAVKALIGSKGASTIDSLEVLKKRYARGEISEEAFNRIKKEL